MLIKQAQWHHTLSLFDEQRNTYLILQKQTQSYHLIIRIKLWVDLEKNFPFLKE